MNALFFGFVKNFCSQYNDTNRIISYKKQLLTISAIINRIKTQNIESCLQSISEAIKYLEKSAENYCTWANNKLGELYREGYINIYYETIGKSESRQFKKIDRQKAKGYYLSAIDYFIDKDSAWAAYHLLESYSDELDRDTKNRCRDIIEIAKNKEIIEKYKLLKTI